MKSLSAVSIKNPSLMAWGSRREKNALIWEASIPSYVFTLLQTAVQFSVSAPLSMFDSFFYAGSPPCSGGEILRLGWMMRRVPLQAARHIASELREQALLTRRGFD